MPTADIQIIPAPAQIIWFPRWQTKAAQFCVPLTTPQALPLRCRATTPSGTQIPLTGGYPNCGTQSNGYQCPTSDFGNVYRTSATMPLDEPASGAWKLCVADTGASGARQVVKHVALTVH